MLDLSVSSYNEYIPRSQLQPQESPDQKQSPRVAKNVNKRAQQKQQSSQPNIVLPESLVNGHGIPPGVQSFLEVHLFTASLLLLLNCSDRSFFSV